MALIPSCLPSWGESWSGWVWQNEQKSNTFLFIVTTTWHLIMFSEEPCQMMLLTVFLNHHYTTMWCDDSSQFVWMHLNSDTRSLFFWCNPRSAAVPAVFAAPSGCCASLQTELWLLLIKHRCCNLTKMHPPSLLFPQWSWSFLHGNKALGWGYSNKVKTLTAVCDGMKTLVSCMLIQSQPPKSQAQGSLPPGTDCWLWTSTVRFGVVRWTCCSTSDNRMGVAKLISTGIFKKYWTTSRLLNTCSLSAVAPNRIICHKRAWNYSYLENTNKGLALQRKV